MQSCLIQPCQPPPVRGPRWRGREGLLQAAGRGSGQETTSPTGRQATALGPHPLHQAAAPQTRSEAEPRLGRAPREVATLLLEETAASSAARREPWAGPCRLPMSPQAQQGPGTQRNRREIPEPARPPQRHAGRSYRERAPASRAAESEVQLVLWPGGSGPQQRSPGPGVGREGRGTSLKGVTWSLKAQRIEAAD